MIKLIGIVIVVFGFVLKKDTIATVVTAGIVTGLVSGMNIIEVLDILGTTFTSQRLMTLFILTLPVIGISERYGLKQRAVELIKKTKKISVGGINIIYLALRQITSALSLRLGGHPQFVRPIINPMAQGAAIVAYKEIDQDDVDLIKASACAQDNYGNFFGQNLFLGAGGVLLIVGTFSDLGYSVDPLNIAIACIPSAILIFVLGTIQNILLDKKLKMKYTVKSSTKSK